MSCSPSGQQVALKIAGPCISRCVMNTADCGAYTSTVTITLTAGQLMYDGAFDYNILGCVGRQYLGLLGE